MTRASYPTDSWDWAAMTAMDYGTDETLRAYHMRTAIENVAPWLLLALAGLGAAYFAFRK